MPQQIDPTAGPAEPTTAADKAWQASFDADSDAFMTDILGKLEGDDASDSTDGGDVEQPEIPAPEGDKPGPSPEELAELLAKSKEKESEAEQDGEDAEEEKPEEDKTATSTLLRMLEQEKVVREERDTLKAEREAFEAEKAAWTEEQSKAQQDSITADQLRQVLLTTPEKLLEVLGIETPRVSQLLVAHLMGDKATPELKALRERAQTDARTLALETELKQMKMAEAARAETEKVQRGAAEYVKKGLSKHCPTVAEVAKVNAARVQEEIFQEIANDAAKRARREPNGKPISFDEAARRVEKRWSEIAGAIKSRPTEETKTVDSKNDSKSGAANAQKPATPSIAPSQLAPKATLRNQYEADLDWEAESEKAIQEAIAKSKRPRK